MKYFSLCSGCYQKKNNCKCADEHKEKQKMKNLNFSRSKRKENYKEKEQKIEDPCFFCNEEEEDETICFIASHDFNSVVTQPCNGSSTVVFENFTDNHNKTGIEAITFTPAPCTGILIIETSDGGPPIERVLERTENLSIEVENVSRVSVRCEGNPTGSCQVNIRGSKTFCICCPKSLDSHCCSPGNLREENCDCMEEQEVETTCFIDTHSLPISVYTLPCNGSSTMAFEDVTNNHNKTMIQATSFTPAPCTAILTIETKDGCPPIERILPSLLEGGSPTQLNIEVEDVRSVSIRCQGNPLGSCDVFLAIQKTFCICCPQNLDLESCFDY